MFVSALSRLSIIWLNRGMSSRPVNDAYSLRLLQFFDQTRKCRLYDVQVLRGERKVSDSGHGNKGAHLAHPGLYKVP
jgi:hypothetical protein